MDCIPPGSSVNGDFWARILEWVAISFAGRSPRLCVENVFSALAGGFFTTEPPGKPNPGMRHLQIN